MLTPRPKLPPVGELIRLVRAVRKDIDPDYRAFHGDDCPGIQLTVGCNTRTGEWSYQTGDNSYTGGAYHYPHWGVVGVYRLGSARDIARDIRSQIAEGHYSAVW